MRTMISFENTHGGISSVFVDDISYIQDTAFHDSRKNYTLVQLKNDSWVKAKYATAQLITDKVQKELERISRNEQEFELDKLRLQI